MPVIKAHIILLCLAGYLVTIEARYLAFVINNDALSGFKENPIKTNNGPKTSAVAARIIKWLHEAPLNQKVIDKRNRLKNNIGKLKKKRERNDALRDNERYHIPTVNNFLQKLNNFLNRNTNNKNNGPKRDICSGFGTPGSRNMCKKEKNRHLGNWRRKRDLRREYTQHMFEERARSDSDSESGWSDDDDLRSDDDGDGSDDINDVSDDNRARPGKKSRFKIVDNSKSKKKLRDTDSEEMSIESKPAYSSDSDNESQRSSVEDSSGDYEKPERPRYHSESESEEKKEPEKDSDELDDENRTDDEVSDKYMYLQGTRLQKPYGRSQHYRSGRRDPNRMSYFLPKRFNWDSDMLYDLADFWNFGIKVAHTHY